MHFPNPKAQTTNTSVCLMESIVLPSSKTLPHKFPQISLKPHQPQTYTPSWTTDDAHLARLSTHGKLPEAISSLDSIIQRGSSVKPRTLYLLIDACIVSHSLHLCHELHSRVRKVLQHPSPNMGAKLVGMFAKCGSLANALKVFDEMPQRNLYAWSAVIGACSRERKWAQVIQLFYRMMAEGEVLPDEFMFPKILQACGNSRDVETGRLIHAMVVKCGKTEHDFVRNTILALYAKCGCLDSAEKLFKGMEVTDIISWNAVITGYCQMGKIKEARRFLELMCSRGVEPNAITWNMLVSSCNHLGKCDVAMELMNEMRSSGTDPDVFTWTSMILGFAQNNRRLEALKLFRDMVLDGVEPNEVTLMSAFSACSSMKDLRKGMDVHLVAIKLGYGKDVLVGNSLIDMYSKCGKLDAARQVFDMVTEKDVYTWNSMIRGYCQAGSYGIAHDLFKQMQKSDVLPDTVTWNVMIAGHMQNGDEDQAIDLFSKMEIDGGVKRNTASWNAIIAGYTHLDKKKEALRIFRQMQSVGAKPNSVTILSILPACANLIAVKKLKEIHGCVFRRTLESEPAVANSLIGTYAKSGNIHCSKVIFDGMLSKDIITWNSMISAYVLHGCGKEAIELFERMKEQGCRPNRNTFASVLLAYGQANMVDEGRQIFETMTEKYQISPCLEHYAAMVNLYGRSGKLDEAFEFIGGMPIEPDACTWSALLTACRRYGNVKLAILALERLLELEPDVLIHRLLIQLYGLHGISKDLWNIKCSGIRKESAESVGRSWIEDKNIVHTFAAGDLQQVNGISLHAWIKSIELKLKATKNSDMLVIQEEDNEGTGGIHSEKIALGFLLINSPETQRNIRIIKNLRMCEHCHSFAEMITKTHECELYISDSKCLHHFKQGSCSCGEYW